MKLSTVFWIAAAYLGWQWWQRRQAEQAATADRASYPARPGGA